MKKTMTIRGKVGLVGNTTTPAPSVCALCGSAVDNCCLVCASQVLDFALAGGLDCPLDALDGDFFPDGNSLLAYEHYEVCLTGEGNPWELGRGAMGVTYKAFDTDLHRPVALKIIHPAILEETGSGERFLREARSLAQLRHPNIATIFRLGRTDAGDYFYAMEFIEGETLDARVRRQGALSATLALEISVQLARALVAAEAEGIVHRDIKPSNIMLLAPSTKGAGEIGVKLIDFGLAKVVASEEHDAFVGSYFIGTPDFASPEQIRDGQADARSDIFSLGKCLEFMLKGGEQVGQPGLTIPGTVGELLGDMLADQPSGRPPTAKTLESRLQDCQDSLRGVRGTGDYLVFRGWEIFRDRPLPAFLLAGLAIILAALGLVHRPYQNGPARPQLGNVLEPQMEARLSYARGEEYREKFTHEDNQRAITEYQRALSISPAYADAHASLALAYYQEFARFGASKEMMDRATESARRAIVLDQKNPRGHHALAAIRTLEQRPWDALTELHHAMEGDAKYLPAVRDFSVLWGVVGKPQFSLVWALHSIELEPTNLSGYDIAADAYTDLCEDDQAEGCYRRCLQVNPAWIDAHCGLLHLHLLHGDYAQARRAFAAAEAIQSGAICPLTLNAQIAFFSGDYAEAELLYRRLLAMDRQGLINLWGNISYLSALGYLRLKAGDSAEGNALLEEASKMHVDGTNGPQALYDLAAIRCVQDRKQEALLLLGHAIDAGWLSHRSARLDPRFESLRGNPEFEDLLSSVHVRIARLANEAKALRAKPAALSDYPVRIAAIGVDSKGSK